MAICALCGHSLTDESTLVDQVGAAHQDVAPHKKVKEPRHYLPSSKEVFNALLYLGKSHEYNDLVAFYLLHQVFVCLSRHDRVEDWPTREEMWHKAEEKAHEALEQMAL